MNAARPRAFALLVPLLTGLAGSVVLVAALQLREGAAAAVVWPIVALFVAAAVLEVAPVGVNEDITVTMSVVVVFVAVAVGGLPAAVAAGAAVGLGTFAAIERDRFVKTLYNVDMHVLAAASAALVFSRVTGVPLFHPDPAAALADPLGLTLGLLAAGLVYTLANALIVSMAVHVVSGVPYRPTAMAMVREIVPLQFLYVGLAAIAYTLLVETGWVSLVLIAVPLLLARRSLRTVQERQEAYDRMVRAFVKAIELKDGYTRGHAERVSDLSVLVAERMGLSYEERQLIRYGAILHDVGKIGVSLGILCKAGPLSDGEFDEMKRHPEIGAELLRDIDFLKPALAIVHHHHERIDGRGYPTGLTGGEIPLLTRVVTAVDAFDAMTSTRSYRRAQSVEVALEELRANAGTQFDSEVVDHLVALVHEEGWEITDEPVAVAPTSQAAGMTTP